MTKIIKCIGYGELKEVSKKCLCKQCYRKKYHEINKEHIKEQGRIYRQRPEVKEHIKEHNKGT